VLVFASACGRTPAYGAEENDSDGCVLDLGSHTQDCDDDGIPDGDDPFPEDATRPGRARDDIIYACSPTRLYLIAPDDEHVPLAVGDFQFADGSGGPVTDIAIDHFGVFYAVTLAELYVCDPTSVNCWALGPLPTDSLAFLPVGVLDDDDSVLVTVVDSSTWTRVDLRGPEVSTTVLGSIADAYSSSGDIAYDGYGTTWLMSPTPLGDIFASILPGNGASDLSAGGNLPSGTSGLAAFDHHLWFFDRFGHVIDWEPYWNPALRFHARGPEGFSGAAAHLDAR